MTVQNPFFCTTHKLCMSYVTNTFLLHGQGQKSEQKPATKNFVGFHNHSPLLTMFRLTPLPFGEGRQLQCAVMHHALLAVFSLVIFHSCGCFFAGNFLYGALQFLLFKVLRVDHPDSLLSDSDKGNLPPQVFVLKLWYFSTSLLQKLHYYRICCTSNQWFASYLDDRTVTDLLSKFLYVNSEISKILCSPENNFGTSSVFDIY